MALSDSSSASPVIALVAGETSGDTLGAGLIKSLKLRYPAAKFVGIGGTKMIYQGLESWYPMEKLSVMGIFEVLKYLPELLMLRRSLIKKLLSINPDVFIGIDAPDFNFKVEKNLKEKGIKSIHYVSPSIWAWRESRLKNIKQSVDGVLALFPFETCYYDKYNIPVKFVGHPLANEVPENPQREIAKKSLELNKNQLIIGLLPGSRMSEITKMADVYIKVAIKLKENYPEAHFLVPCVHQKARSFIEKCINEFGEQDLFTLVDGKAQRVMEASDYLVVTSGTATLEAALMMRPMIIAIKINAVSYWLMKKMSTTEWIGLPNVLAQDSIVPELIQEQASVDNIVSALRQLMSDDGLKQKQLEAFKKQYKTLKKNASELAADAVELWAELK